MFFEWDPKKAKSNLKKHKVSFEEATTVFKDPFSYTFPDEDHSVDEERFLIIGQSIKGLLLVVAHVDRNYKTRIISARKATLRELKFYEEAKK